MTKAVEMVQVWRGDLCESVHQGHAVICDHNGAIQQAWGDPDAVIYPRSACKMIQALPLLESGAGAHLRPQQLALACASHQGAPLHVQMVGDWLADLGLGDDDFRCGPQASRDHDLYLDMIRAQQSPCRVHNNCSGKHAGFLTLAQHLRAGPDYTEIDHPVQIACKSAFEDVTAQTSPAYGIDGCSAPNHACTLHGLAQAMAFFASAQDRSDARSTAAARLTAAMIAFPELVAGQGRACTELMQAMGGKVAVKTGAEGVFVAILPQQRLGVALKITDGATRASECAMAAILVKLGVLDAAHPAARARMVPPVLNWDGRITGRITPAAALL